jgi:hypothetical protein
MLAAAAAADLDPTQAAVMSLASCRSLPDEVWKRIVADLSTHERFASCSLVNQQLNRATAAATQHVGLISKRPAKAEALGLYLHKHGHHLTSLDTEQVDGIWKQLPCSQLRQLRLTVCQLQLAPSESDPGILHSCSGLTSLSLSYCTVLVPSTSLTAVAALTSLQCVNLKDCYVSSGAGGMQKQMASLLLPHLPNLTHLSFSEAPAGPDAGTMLLSCIARMPCLQHLVLDLWDFNWPDGIAVWPDDIAAYSALTASSNLQHLQLDGWEVPRGVWRGVWQVMFPAGKTWPFWRWGDAGS